MVQGSSTADGSRDCTGLLLQNIGHPITQRCELLFPDYPLDNLSSSIVDTHEDQAGTAQGPPIVFGYDIGPTCHEHDHAVSRQCVGERGFR